MTKEQLERLKELDEKCSWTIQELGERDKLMRLFYRHYGPAIHDFEKREPT